VVDIDNNIDAGAGVIVINLFCLLQQIFNDPKYCAFSVTTLSSDPQFSLFHW